MGNIENRKESGNVDLKDQKRDIESSKKLSETEVKKLEEILDRANKDLINFFALSKYEKDFNFIYEKWPTIKDTNLGNNFKSIVKKYLDLNWINVLNEKNINLIPSSYNSKYSFEIPSVGMYLYNDWASDNTRIETDINKIPKVEIKFNWDIPTTIVINWKEKQVKAHSIYRTPYSPLKLDIKGYWELNWETFMLESKVDDKNFYIWNQLSEDMKKKLNPQYWKIPENILEKETDSILLKADKAWDRKCKTIKI